MEFDILSVGFDCHVNPIAMNHCHRHAVTVFFIVADNPGRSPGITTVFGFDDGNVLICQSPFIIRRLISEINLHGAVRKFEDAWFVTTAEDIPVPNLGFVDVTDAAPRLAHVIRCGNRYRIRRL